MNAPDAIRETSYARAVDQALEMAGRGLSPKQAIDGAGLGWGKRHPTWDDAVYALAYAWRRSCLPGPEIVDEPVEQAPEPQAPKPQAEPDEDPEELEPLPVAEARPRRCLKCGRTFPSTGPGNRICPDCAARNRATSGSFEP